MSHNADLPTEDRTARTTRMDVVEERALQAEKTVKRIWFWLGIISAIAIAMFALAAYLGSFAHATELVSVKTEVAEMKQKQSATDARTSEMSARVGWLCEAFGQLAIQQRISLPPVPTAAPTPPGPGNGR